jgi:hypothetical protein
METTIDNDIDNVLLKMVVLTKTCKGRRIKNYSFYQSHWTVARILYIITSVTNKDEPSYVNYL